MAAATIPNTFIDNAKVMAKGQVTIPKDVRQVLGISNGSRVTFLVENGSVRLINSAVYAMEMMQREMNSECTDLQTEDDVNKLVKATRDKEN
nr:MAG TPA: SpoVT / AbrB like domain [Caudoviricetes sp.]